MKTRQLFTLFFILTTACVFSSGCLPVCGWAGSYPCVQYWELDVSEAELIAIITEIKKEDPGLLPPSDTAYVHGRSSYWMMIDFYYTDTREEVHTWTRPAVDPHKTTLALIGFSGPGAGDTKLINADFGWRENARQINKFKKQILSRIEEKILNRKQNL